MIRAIGKKLMLTCINIFFPPLTVLILTGPGMDTVVNCFLFLLAVLPSHIHGFFISFVMYSRMRKVRKGTYPGEPHTFIYSEKINNGGLTNEEVYERWFAKDDDERRLAAKRTRTHSRSSSAARSDVSRQYSRRQHRPALSRTGSADGPRYHATRSRTMTEQPRDRSTSPGYGRYQQYILPSSYGSAPMRQRPVTTVRT